MAARKPLIYRVHDPDDDVDFLRFVQNLHSPPDGRFEAVITS